MNMGNYQALEQIGVTAGGTLHLARHVQDGTLALLKLPAHDSAPDGLRHEYALLQSFNVPEILKPIALQEDGARAALVLEPFDGESLDAALSRQQRFALPVALTIASQLARALAALHAAGITHHDIRPANVLLARGHIQVKLADLSRAASGESTADARPAAVGDWAYISPSQTGRMHRQVDYRTDFYSLGILLYRLLTGQLPFQADDPLEWVHCHLARMPIPPHDLIPDIPQVVSDLVLKLLAKAPEERYQSSGALLADLEHCMMQWQAAGEIAPFALGMRDVSDRFQIPPKLYGREQEIATLLSAFKAVATTGISRLVTVAGYSGGGKSALVHTLEQTIAERHGYFLVGKFDQHKRDIPYATLAQAFDRLVRQLLGESATGIRKWRVALSEALGSNAQLMIHLIPQLELILGPQPPVSDLPPQEAQGRFQLVFQRFLGVFARQEHPLVLLLEDLQWGDTATLALLEHLMTHLDVRYLLLVGTYRNNEVDDNHLLTRSLKTIRQGSDAVQEIVLHPLKLDDVTQLVAESLHCPLAEVQPLVQLVWDKTGGNPFFTRQFLTALAEEKLLAFDASHEVWRWNLPRIQAKGYTDNVVDLLVDKLVRLPQITQDILARFACLGNAVDAATLGLIIEQPGTTVRTLLQEAERAGLVYRQEDTYTFLHDRIQEAAYSLLVPEQRGPTHLRIGRLLVSRLSPEAIEDRIFEVVNQLNRSSELVESQEERERFAELNLIAGRRAREATAYASALNYLAAGCALLAQDCWTRCYALAFALEFHRAECEYLTGALAAAEQHLSMLNERISDHTDLAAVTRVRIDLFTTLVRSDRAVEAGLDYLRRVGIQWSPHPDANDVQQEFDRIWQQVAERRIEALVDLPLMRDPDSRATMDVLTTLLPPALFTDENLLGLVVGRMANLSLAHGHSDGSSLGYAWLGMFLGPRFGNYQAGFRFGKLGLDLVDQRGLDRFKARVYVHFGNVVTPWARPFHTGCTWVRRAFETANANGDLTFAVYSCNHLVTNLLASGEGLSETQRKAEYGLDFARKARFGLVVDIITVQLQLIRVLRGETFSFSSFNDAGFDEAQFERHLEQDPRLAIAACWYWIRKLQARLLADDVECAVAAASKAQRLLWTSPSHIEVAEYHFYGALAHAARYDQASPEERIEHLAALLSHHRQIEEWAQNCPENFGNRAALVAAEIACIEGRELDAMHLYEQAIQSARANGFVQNEGLAYERAAAFYCARGFAPFADTYLRQARDCYARWGANGKVRQLEARHGQLQRWPKEGNAASLAQLDFLSVVKASQAISGSIVLEELVDTLMRIVIENAGAQAGYLIFVHEEKLTLVAETYVAGQEVRVKLHLEGDLPALALPESILNYVRRSKEAVLLADAAASHPYAGDPYFFRHRPKSVLCLPILRQSALVGILYLENSLATHAFTPNRVQVLELLASQAAISLENAQLYSSDVREAHARIRRLVESNIIGIFFCDLQGNITGTNDAFLRMTGYSRDDVKSGALRWTEITPPEYREIDARALEEIRRTGSLSPFEKEYIRKDGSRVPVLIGGAWFEQSQEGVAFVLDLTERKRAETEQEARHAAEAANRAKSAFLANMSHELRTPLNSILGYARILENDPTLDERHAAKAHMICQGGEHLLAFINNVLDLTRIESGKMELHPIDMNLPRLAQTLVEIIGTKAVQKGLELVFDFAPDMPQWIHADEKRLHQILLNLLSNAVKFTDCGRITLRVRFASPARLCFEVQDTSAGIAADQLATIFEPFKQTDPTRHLLGDASLELAINRQYVRLMGGDIQVESQPGQGCTFKLELDVQLAEGETETHPSLIATGYTGPRRTILVVDDIAEHRALVTDLLTPLGFKVAEAANGSEGLEMAQRLRPDLILMNIAMPELDGLEATRRLRQLEAFREVPILALSASVSTSDHEQSLSAGMNASLPKPLDAGKLLEQMARLLRLEWTYGPANAKWSPEEWAIVAPPQEEMEVLHRLAKLGNMREIMTQAERLSKLDERYRPFAIQLSSLAKAYQSKAVLRLVEEHWKSSMASHAGR